MSKIYLPYPKFLILFTLLISLPFLVVSQSSLSEQEILLQIKHQWSNQPPMNLWNSTTHFCQWPGINCIGGVTVTGISLNGQYVTGAIPSSICDLKNLTVLDLGNNIIHGHFPTILNNCTTLQTLDLSLNFLVGKLPDNIDELPPNLQHLDLSANSFTGDIPSSLAQLKGLITLYLNSNLFNGTFPSELGHLENLEELHLANNPFTPNYLPKEFGMLMNLKFLWMTQCNLIGSLPPELGLHSKLTEIDVSDNAFTGQLPENLCCNGKLSSVVASNNYLNGTIPASLGKCNSLNKVEVYNNSLSGEVPKGLWSLRNIETMLLSENQFSGMLPSHLSAYLQVLDISNNKFSGPIPSSITKCRHIYALRASNNQLRGKIPMELTALSFLYSLELDGNQLSGELPSKLISWESLAFLNLSNNNLSGPLPADLGSLPNLQDLDLSKNKLSGQIPHELPLTTLNLSSNNLTGKVPRKFDNEDFSLSFLDNPNLCSDKQISHLPQCYHRRYLVGILVPGAIIFLIFLCFTFFKISIWRHEEHSSEQQAWELKPFHRIEFTEATIVSSLTNSNLIGTGGSGKVYMTPINDLGDKVAVKRIWNGRKLEDALEKQFLTEVEFLGTFRHANIVKLLCCISSAQEKLLVYEYMENQSPDKWLHKKQRANEPSSMNSGTSRSNLDPNIVLDWPTRLKIAVGAAKGLCYLHHACSPAIIHRDVKSSNILLDSEFNAKIADFGLAKVTIKAKGPHTASAIAGSFGYIAPEYWRTNRLDENIDVYSFGVVLLELTTGKHPCKGNDHLNLADWSWKHCCEEHSIIDALDKEIMEPRFIEQMVNVFKLGVMCTSQTPSSRPTMKQVVQLLIEWSHHEDHDQTQTTNEA